MQEVWEVTKSFEIAIGHRIEGHPGKCVRSHGHTLMGEVTVVGYALNELGMVVDFALIKSVIEKEVIDVLDHRFLNDVLLFNPTVENLAKWIYERLCSYFNVKEVVLQESSSSKVRYYR